VAKDDGDDDGRDVRRLVETVKVGRDIRRLVETLEGGHEDGQTFVHSSTLAKYPLQLTVNGEETLTMT